MAGPFSSTGNQAQDIERVQLQGGFSPDAGLAGVAAAVLGEALPRITEAHASDLQQDITNRTESIKEALLAAQNPALAQSLFKEEALKNPITREAFKQFNLIQGAAQSGKLPRQYALERLEAIQDEAIANNPAFEKEIRAAMTQATGVDPNKQTFANLLSAQKSDLSPEAKAQLKVRQEAAENNVSFEDQLEMNNTAVLAQHAQNILDQRKANGTYSLLDTAKEVNQRGGVIMLDLLGQVRKQSNLEGGVTPEFMATIKQQLNTNIAAAIASITAASDGVTGTQLVAELAPLKAMQASIDGMIEDGSFLKMTQNNVTLKKAILEDSLLQQGDMAAAWAFGGPQGFQALLEFQALAPTQASEDVLSRLSPRARAAFTLRNIGANVVAKQYGLLGTGVPAETTNEKTGRTVAAGLVLATQGLTDDQYNTASSEGDNINRDFTWQAMGSRKVANVVKNSNALKASLISLQESNTAGLGEEIAQLLGSGTSRDNFELQGDKLVFVFPKANATSGFAPGVSDTSKEQAFVARFNRANQISALHRRTGTLPAARYTTTAAYWDTVQNLFGEQQAEKSGQPVKPLNPAGVSKWGRDESGKPVLIK